MGLIIAITTPKEDARAEGGLMGKIGKVAVWLVWCLLWLAGSLTLYHWIGALCRLVR